MKKINIHLSNNNNKASKNFLVNIDQVRENNYWVQKGGNDNHLIPNFNVKFPLEKIFSKDTSQEISSEYFSLPNPVVDKNNIYILNTDGNVISINKNNFRINWKRKIFSKQFDFPNLGSIVVQLKKNNLYLHNGGNLIVALNKMNGDIKWKFVNDFPFRGNISIKIIFYW